jgi:hypothetical protein
MQAIHASAHAGRVVATDINARALAFAGFNAQLNGAANIELRQGSFFEPVAGERFGLVACNPPFVISPETAYLFRDGGLEGDAVSRQVLETIPGMLEEGAFATVLLSWAHRRDEDWSAPLRAWLEGSGCDAILLHHVTQDPLSHAASWNREHHGSDPEAFEAALARWLDYLDRLGIDGIAYGGAVLRRREAASNWLAAHSFPLSRVRPASAHLVRMFDAHDFLEQAGDAALARERLVLAEQATVEQRVVLEAGSWNAESARLVLGEGLSFEARIDGATAQLLAELDGRRTLAEAASELAARHGQVAEDVVRGALPVVRGLLELGCLVRVG